MRGKEVQAHMDTMMSVYDNYGDDHRARRVFIEGFLGEIADGLVQRDEERRALIAEVKRLQAELVETKTEVKGGF